MASVLPVSSEVVAMDVITNPIKAIRAFCLECSCGSTAEVKSCPVEKCPLFPFRLGKNPYRQRREFQGAEYHMSATESIKAVVENAGSLFTKGVPPMIRIIIDIQNTTTNSNQRLNNYA